MDDITDKSTIWIDSDKEIVWHAITDADKLTQ